MIKLTVKFLLISAMLCVAFLFAGCGGANNNAAPNNAKKDNTTNTVKPEAAKTEAPKTDAAPAGEKIGVAECDDYLEKLEACLTSAPEASRSAVKSGLETTRKSWKDLAANPQTKSGLTSACKTALDTAKQTYSYCKW